MYFEHIHFLAPSLTTLSISPVLPLNFEMISLSFFFSSHQVQLVLGLGPALVCGQLPPRPVTDCASLSSYQALTIATFACLCWDSVWVELGEVLCALS